MPAPGERAASTAGWLEQGIVGALVPRVSVPLTNSAHHAQMPTGECAGERLPIIIRDPRPFPIRFRRDAEECRFHGECKQSGQTDAAEFPRPGRLESCRGVDRSRPSSRKGRLVTAVNCDIRELAGRTSFESCLPALNQALARQAGWPINTQLRGILKANKK